MDLVVHPRIIPPHNLFGHHGPLCHECSGLGQTLRLGLPGQPTRHTSRCNTCRGTGVDKQQMLQKEVDSLLKRIDEMELRWAKQLGAKTPRMSRQGWMELIAWQTAAGTSVNTTTTETIVSPNVTIPAGYMADGRALRLRLTGHHSTLGSGTVTVTWRIRWGGVAGTLLAASGAMTQLISLTAAYWDLDLVVNTRSNGATGTLMVNGIARVFGATAPTIGSATGAPAVGPMTAGGQVTPAAVTVDLTADTALAVSVQMGASSASNIVVSQQYNLESMN